MTTTLSDYVTVLWEAKAKAGREAAMKEFMTAAVTASRHDPGNIDYEAHEDGSIEDGIRLLRPFRPAR